MNKFLIILLTVSLSYCSFDDPVSFSENDVPPLSDEQLDKYYNDAAYINYLEIISDNSQKHTQVYLDEQKISIHYSDLLLIHRNSYKLGESFIQNFLNISNIYFVEMYNIVALADTNKLWVRNIVRGDSLSGIQSIDSLLLNYGVKIKVTAAFFNFILELISTTPYNSFALSRKFFETGEFLAAHPNMVGGDGSFIHYKVENNIKIYIYRFGWEDCHSGCIKNHYWEIGIDSSNGISLIREYGDSLK